MDQTSDILNEEVRASLLQAYSRRVEQVKAIFDRLVARGDYGICQDCRKFIGLARLRALPFAHRCARCQVLAERHERWSVPSIVDLGGPGDDR